jgi:hypothetical protein
MMERIKATSQKIAFVKLMSDKTGVPSEYVFIVSILVIFFLLLTKLVSFLQIILLMAYPSILTFRYLQKYEAKKGDSTDGLNLSAELNKEKSAESSKLLKFWAASGIFSLIDMVVGFVLSGIIFNVVKGLLIMWMVWPDSTLPTKIFDYVMSPLMKKYGGQIDGIMNFVKKTTDDTINSVSEKAESFKKDITDKLVDQVKTNLMEKSN